MPIRFKRSEWISGAKSPEYGSGKLRLSSNGATLILWGYVKIAKENDCWEANGEAGTNIPQRPKCKSVYLL